MWLNERNLDIRCVRLKPYKDGDRTLLDVQTVIPLPEAESYQVKIREKQQKERLSRRSNRDFTRYYDVTVNGVTVTNQPKRGVMYHVIKPILDSGVTPEQVNKIVSWRKNMFISFDEELDGKQVLERLEELDTGGKVPKHRRSFSQEDEIFHVEGKTYLLSNQWGYRTIEAVGLLKKRFPELDIEVVPVSK